MTIVERLFDIMDRKKLKSTELAQSLGVNPSVISSWKKRNTSPPTDYLIQICEFIGEPIDYLLTGTIANKGSSMHVDTGSLTDDAYELLSMYSLLSQEGRKWVKYLIKGYLKDNENLSSSPCQGESKKAVESA